MGAPEPMGMPTKFKLVLIPDKDTSSIGVVALKCEIVLTEYLGLYVYESRIAFHMV